MTTKIIIDVREPDEYKAHHIPNSINIPLTTLHQLDNYTTLLSDKTLCLVCKSGRRAQMAKPSFDAQGMTCDVYPGGLDQWKSEGKPIQSKARHSISIFRQVQIIVGFLVATCAILGLTVDIRWVWGAAIFGTALGVAGIFGFCLLAELLNKMPWNKINS